MRGFGKMSHKPEIVWNPITPLLKLHLTPIGTSRVVYKTVLDDHGYGVATFPLGVYVSARSW